MPSGVDEIVNLKLNKIMRTLSPNCILDINYFDGLSPKNDFNWNLVLVLPLLLLLRFPYFSIKFSSVTLSACTITSTSA